MCPIFSFFVRRYLRFVSLGLISMGIRSTIVIPYPSKADDLLGIVREHADLLHAEVHQDLGTDAVVPQVLLESQLDVRLHGVAAVLLQLIGLDLVHQADAPALLMHVDDDALAGLVDDLHGRVELVAAVAAHGPEDVARHALGVHPDEHGIVGRDLALHQGYVLHLVHVVLVDDELEVPAEGGGECRRRCPADEGFRLHPEVDEIGDGDDLEPVLFREDLQVGHPRHGAVVLHDFADDAAGFECRKPREIHGAFRLARAHQDAALAGQDGEYVPRAHDVVGLHIVRDGRADRRGPVVGRDARRHTAPGLDGDGEGRLEARLVVIDHEVQVELLRQPLVEGEADETPPVPGHEIDGFGGDELRGHAEIALVFTILVVDEDDHLAVFDVFDCFRYRADCHDYTLCLAAISKTRAPGGSPC